MWKPLQHVQRLARPLRDHFQAGLPHITTDKSQFLDDVLPQRIKPSAQSRLGAPRPNPQQTPAVPINLIDHREKIRCPFALTPVNLINAHRPDRLQLAMRQSPLHKPLDRSINRFPTRLKYSRRLSPGEPPRPACQKSHHRRRDRSLAHVPGHILDHHAMRFAVHPARRVEKVNHDAPEWHEQPAAFIHHIVSRARFQALRTFPRHPLIRSDLHLDPWVARSLSQSNALVNESNKMLNQVQQRLNFQLSGWCFLFFHPIRIPNRLTITNHSLHFRPWPIQESFGGKLKRAERRLSSLSSRRSAVEVSRHPVFDFYPQILLQSR